MNRHLLCVLTGLLPLWCGCSSPSEVEDPEQVIIIQGFLAPGRDTQVHLRRTLPPERYYDGLEDTLAGAKVEISVEGETFVLSEDPRARGSYRIADDVMPVVSGRTYRLQATHGEHQARASTTIPFEVEITHATADTIVYFQHYADLFGDLVHPGEFRWTRSENAAGYVVIVEAVEVRSLGEWALPLTSDLDSLIARRERLEGQAAPDSLEALERQIEALRDFFEENVSLVGSDGKPIRWLRDRDQEDWDEIDTRDWSDGRKWRERMDELSFSRVIDYWVPADTLRGDYWWLGVRFEAEYKITLQAADRNYFDYYTTSFNGQSGNDGDRGPLFHVEGGLGVFGSYAEDSFRVRALRGQDPTRLKILAVRE